MKESILVLQKESILAIDLLKSLRAFLENDAFVNRTIHYLKACCCNSVNLSQEKVRRVKIRREDDSLRKWLHKSTDSLCQSVGSCLCDTDRHMLDTEKWIESLHSYAEFLPKFGCHKKLLWLVSGNIKDPENDLGLFGALKRLVEWHGVRIYILCPGSVAYSNELQLWCDVLCAEILTPEMDLTLSTYRRLWSGTVTLTGSQGSSIQLPGFSMCLREDSTSENITIVSPDNVSPRHHTTKSKEEVFTCPVVEEKLELVAAVSLSDVPTYALTDNYFSLLIPSRSKFVKTSKDFLQKLSKDSNLGYIMRLYTGTSWKERTIKDPNSDKQVKKEEKTFEETDKDDEENEWKKLISDNISNVFAEPNKEQMELTGDTGYHQFLVYESLLGEVVAQMMRSTDQIDPSLVEDLQKAENIRLQTSSDHAGNIGNSEVELLLSELPHFRGTDLVDMQCDLEKFQTLILHEWIFEKEKKVECTSVTPGFLLRILQVARQTFLQCQQKSYCSSRPQRKSSIFVKPKLTYLDEPYNQMERTALLMREAQEERAQNGPCGLSPPKAKVLTLDPRQFLKFFKKDGTASKESTEITVQKSPKRRFCKYDSGDLRLDEWPECKFYRYHDIYYHSDASSELEELCERLKSRLLSLETDSTCTLKQTRSTLTVQKDVRKLRTRSKDGGLSEQQDTENIRRSKSKTPKAKKKADTALLEKRKRMALLSKQGQSEENIQKICKQSPGKLCRTPRKTTPNPNPKRTPKKSSAKTFTPKKTPKKNATPRKNTKSPLPKKSKEYTLEDKKARAKRHAQLLENTLTRVLERHGVPSSDKNFKTCFQKLYTITKCFLKDLTTVTSLRVEMESIAEDNVQNVLKRVLKK